MADAAALGELEGKAVVVTGAGRGLGREVALLCRRLGADVVAADVDGPAVERLAAGCAGGRRLVPARVDVADEASVAGLAAVARAELGHLDGWVNDAAVMVVGRVHELAAEDWAKALAVNATGVFYGCKHAIRAFLDEGHGGSIVNVASISAVVGLPGQAAYCASKGAVLQLTKQIAADYAPYGIRCNSVGPGSIGGEFLDAYLAGLDDPGAARAAIVGAHPIGRVAEAREVAEPVAFLLSERSSFVTGANLQVDGGYTAI